MLLTARCAGCGNQVPADELACVKFSETEPGLVVSGEVKLCGNCKTMYAEELSLQPEKARDRQSKNMELPEHEGLTLGRVAQ